MSYRVVAPLVLAKDPEGKTHHCYQNAVIQWLSDEQATHFLESGLVEEVDGDPTPDGEKPAKNATKPVLVAWVVDHVAKDDGSDYTTEEVDQLKVPEIRAIIDSVE